MYSTSLGLADLLTLSLPISNSTFSQPFKQKMYLSEVVRIGSIIIFHLSKRWKAKFSILCDVIFLVRLEGKFEIGSEILIKTIFLLSCVAENQSEENGVDLYEITTRVEMVSSSYVLEVMLRYWNSKVSNHIAVISSMVCCQCWL